jgi:hypothetical protein
VVLMRILLSAAGVDVESVGGALLITVAGGVTGLMAFGVTSIVLLREEYQMARQVFRR